MWGVATNILNKQSRTADSWCSSSLGVGREANKPYRKNPVRYETFHTSSEQDGFFEAQDRDRWRALVFAVMSLRVLAPCTQLALVQ
jgi:hypothetical protein